MKTRQLSILILTLTMLAQSACTTSLPATATTTTDPCPAPTPGTYLLTNAAEGYCLLYPAEYSTDIPRHIVINPIYDAGDRLGEAWVSVVVENADGRTAAQAAEAAIAAAGPGFNITRAKAQVDGRPAEIVDGLPGPDPLRRVFIVHGDRLYTLDFLPWTPNTDAGQPAALENLYKMIMETLHFLPTNP